MPILSTAMVLFKEYIREHFIKLPGYQYPHVVLKTYLIFSYFSVGISMQTVTDSEDEIEMK